MNIKATLTSTMEETSLLHNGCKCALCKCCVYSTTATIYKCLNCGILAHGTCYHLFLNAATCTKCNASNSSRPSFFVDVDQRFAFVGITRPSIEETVATATIGASAKANCDFKNASKGLTMALNEDPDALSSPTATSDNDDDESYSYESNTSKSSSSAISSSEEEGLCTSDEEIANNNKRRAISAIKIFTTSSKHLKLK